MLFSQIISILVTYDERVLRIAAALSAILIILIPGSMTLLPLLCQINKKVSGATGNEKHVLRILMGLSCNHAQKLID